MLISFGNELHLGLKMAVSSFVKFPFCHVEHFVIDEQRIAEIGNLLNTVHNCG